MPLPPLHAVSNSQYYLNGNVTIQEGAAIAPGVILQTDADSRIIIAAGVCIGMGAILQAHQGTIAVETGAILGAGVLVIGKGTIGANACVGTATTLYNSSIDAGQVVPSGSLLGDKGRQVAEATDADKEQESTGNPSVVAPENPSIVSLESNSAPSAEAEAQGTTSAEENNSLTSSSLASASKDNSSAPSAAAETTDISKPADHTPEPSANESPSSQPVGLPIYGQNGLQQLLVTLFPYKQALKNSTQDGNT